MCKLYTLFDYGHVVFSAPVFSRQGGAFCRKGLAAKAGVFVAEGVK